MGTETLSYRHQARFQFQKNVITTWTRASRNTILLLDINKYNYTASLIKVTISGITFSQKKSPYRKFFTHSCCRIQWAWQRHLCEGDVPSNKTSIKVEEQTAPELLHIHYGWWTSWWHTTYATRLSLCTRRYYNCCLIIHQILITSDDVVFFYPVWRTPRRYTAHVIEKNKQHVKFCS